jgi:hypothetical protein
MEHPCYSHVNRLLGMELTLICFCFWILHWMMYEFIPIAPVFTILVEGKLFTTTRFGGWSNQAKYYKFQVKPHSGDIFWARF